MPKAKEDLEAIKELLVIIALNQGVQYEPIAIASGINIKTLKNNFPIKRIRPSQE